MDQEPENLREFIGAVLEKYPRPERIGGVNTSNEEAIIDRVHKDHSLYSLIVERGARLARDNLQSVTPFDQHRYDISPSIGQTNPAHIPYVPMLRQDETDTPQYGRYIVYLFDSINKRAWLSFMIGSQKGFSHIHPDVSSKKEILASLSGIYRNEFPNEIPFNTGDLELSEDLQRAEQYSIGSICHAFYDLENLPPNEVLLEDLADMFEIYNNVLDSEFEQVVVESGLNRVWRVDHDALNGYSGGPPPNPESEAMRSPTIGIPDYLFEEINSDNNLESDPVSDGDIVIIGSSEAKGPDIFLDMGRVVAHDGSPEAETRLEISWVDLPTTSLSVNTANRGPFGPRQFELMETEMYRRFGINTAKLGVATGNYESLELAVDRLPELHLVQDYSSSISGKLYNRDKSNRGKEKASGSRDARSSKSASSSESINIEISKSTVKAALNEFANEQKPDKPREPDSLGSSDENPEEVLPTPEAEPDISVSLEQQLRRSKQVILYGPPGTGKTWTAMQFARWWLHQEIDPPRNEHLELTTLHPAYSYENFIEGISVNARGGGVSYGTKPGILQQVASRAIGEFEDPSGDSANPYILIIDEMNRGDLPQILGEVMTSLEPDKRLGESSEVHPRLAHSQRPFALPPNLYIIGTMNTADRSIALIDAAIRRRFSFIPMPPDFGKVRSFYSTRYDPEASLASIDPADLSDGYNIDAQFLELSIRAAQDINSEILSANDLGKGKQIGHTHLLGCEDNQELVNVWNFNIMPLLEEYFFGNMTRLATEVLRDEDTVLIDDTSESLHQGTLSELANTLETVTGEDAEREWETL